MDTTVFVYEEEIKVCRAENDLSMLIIVVYLTDTITFSAHQLLSTSSLCAHRELIKNKKKLSKCYTVNISDGITDTFAKYTHIDEPNNG